MEQSKPESIRIKGDLHPDETEKITETDNLCSTEDDDGITEISLDTEEARARVLALLIEKGYTILDK